jgi:hypothetical protein
MMADFLKEVIAKPGKKEQVNMSKANMEGRVGGVFQAKGEKVSNKGSLTNLGNGNHGIYGIPSFSAQ